MIPTQERADEPPWLRVARRELGIKETPGPGANPRILQYFQATKLIPQAGDETAWCSAFVCWVMEQSNVRSTRRANARSWLSWGISLLEPQPGAVVILSRGPEPIYGHVGLWVGESGDRLLVLGGNQGNSVSIVGYPKARVLGYRWPATMAPAPSAA